MFPAFSKATQPTDAAQTARFWDRAAKRYAAKVIGNPEAYAHKLAMTREVLQPQADVLEIGGGTGSTAIAHAPYARQIRCTDVSERMLAIAMQKAQGAGVENVQFVRASAAEALSGTARYDAILALNVLHLMKSWQGIIEQAYEALLPGGFLISSTPCLQDIAPWLRTVAPLGNAVGLLPELAFFTGSELKQAVGEAGFSVHESWQHSPRNGLFLIGRKA